MMGERGMWFKQHFFEWAAAVPFVVHAPDRFAPARVARNTSLVDLLPTLMDLAEPGFDDYAAPLDGTSLVGALTGDTSGLPDTAISEFAADGSTGPSRMVRKGPWKLMWLEGEDTRLYNVVDDPNETTDRSAGADCTEIRADLEAILFDNWDPDHWRKTIRASQERRLAVHEITGGVPTYVNLVRDDDAQRYVRNAGAADTKAKARLPMVAAAQPD